MPGDIQLRPGGVDDGPEVVRFKTACGKVSGTAFRKSGMCETHYDVVKARRLAKPSRHWAWRPARPKMVQSKGDIGCFEVIGQVKFFFDDGIFTVEAHVFDFRVEPDEIDQPVNLGDWVQLEVRNLVL